MSFSCYLRLVVQSRWDVAESGCRAVLPRPVVLVPVAAAPGDGGGHGAVGQEEEDEELHADRLRFRWRL